MNILLHICCAPCAIYPIEELTRGGHKTAGFFYNPNIHPYSEYLKRKEAVEKYAKCAGINVIFSDYDIETFFQRVVYPCTSPEPLTSFGFGTVQDSAPRADIYGAAGMPAGLHNEAMSGRCPVCWWLRLEKTARFAKENGFDAFTTTLIGSPYQDQMVIQAIAEEIAKNSGTSFYSADFKKGFGKAHDTAKTKGIYCQNYCGCVFSERERVEEKGAGK